MVFAGEWADNVRRILRLLGKERAIVSPMAGTTRDTIDCEVERKGQAYRLAVVPPKLLKRFKTPQMLSNALKCPQPSQIVFPQRPRNKGASLTVSSALVPTKLPKRLKSPHGLMGESS